MGVVARGGAAHREPGNGHSSCADHEFREGSMGTPHGNGVWMDDLPHPQVEPFSLSQRNNQVNTRASSDNVLSMPTFFRPVLLPRSRSSYSSLLLPSLPTFPNRDVQ